MNENKMKRKIAAVLCMAMILSASAPGVYAEDVQQNAGESEQPLVELIIPEEKKVEPEAELIVPEEKKVEPEAELIIPEEKKVEPAAELIIPEEKKVEPAAELIVPEEKKVEPAAELIVPEEKKTESVVEAIVPVEKTEPVVKEPELLKKPVTLEAVQPEYAEFKMTASVSGGIITVQITDATDGKMIAIEASGNGVREFNAILTEGGKGSGQISKIDEETEEFTALDAGEYTVRAYYESETSIAKTTTVSVKSTGGSAETVTPPSSGGSAETVTPPSSGGSAETVTPPSSGGSAEPIVPPSSDDEQTQQEVKAFTILPVVTGGEIAVVVDGASSRELEIALLDKDGKQVGRASLIGSGLVQLGKYSSGTYTIRAQYVTPVMDADGTPDYKSVTAQAVVPEGVTADPVPSTPVDIKAKVEKGKDYIIVTVTEAADTEMMVFVDGQSDKSIYKGGSVRFDGLEAGKTYTVEIDYVNYIEGAKKYSETVTLDITPSLAAIQITAVTPGTNILTVSGKATAGQQLIITTQPAAGSDVYALAGENGVFSAQVGCAAGTYTGVTVRYVQDSTITAAASGSWVVAAPAVKPKVTVDEVDAVSTTVVAKTTAGIVAELKTSDYSQKVTADANGILRFSLPHAYGAGTKMTLTVYYGSGQSFNQEITVVAPAYPGLLEYGWEGEAVKKLTKRLEQLGYPVHETSRYGSTVREGVRLFQLANGLHADGVAGPQTLKAIYSVSAIPYGASGYPTLVRGDKGLALIKTLQQRLKDLGYYTIKVDGIFGSGTQRAVREFQRVNGLTVTGKADNATQTLLYSSAAKPASYGVTGDYTTLSRSGKYKSKVVTLQRRLKALGYYSGNIDGYFGSQTYRAVRNFQNRNGLTVTGVADPYTQQVLYSSGARPASGSSSSSGSTSTSTGYRLLYWGCRGDAVTRLQKALIDAGYKSYVRKADGIFGQWTYDAVRAYQKDKGLAVDGIAGKNTQNALYGTSY